MMERLNARLAISLLAVAGALTGCGGGDSNPAAPASSPPPAAPAPTQVAATTCATPPQLFTASVWPSIESTCVTCHASGRVASGTRLVFTVGATPEQNYAVLRTFASANGDLLMSKSIGLPAHSGGKPFVDANSQQYKDLAALMPQMKQTCDTEVLATGQFWTGVKFNDTASVLAKSAVLFAGRNPTAAEYSAVATGGEQVLKQQMKMYMTGPAFDRFLTDMLTLQFLPQGVVVFGQNRGLNATDWPMAAAVINNQMVPQGVRQRFETTLRNEPINLAKYIINNDRPATDLVAGNYTVVNGLVAPLLGATVQGTFVNPNDDTEFLPAVLPNSRLGGNREHAGVITTHAFLDRFPRTDTNRARHTVSETLKRFLATYIPELASRPLEDGNFRITTIDNPGCAVCHDIMDPMTAAFQNWAPNNRYRPNGQGAMAHALSNTYLNNNYPLDYKGNRFYQENDNWYRDMKAPGYGNTPMPNGYNNPTAAQWFGQQIAADSRFALGMVHFTYKGLTGREPLRATTDTTSADAAARTAAYKAQHDEFKDEIAVRFAASGYKVKDLLVDLMMSKAVRANGITGTMNADRAMALGELGVGNMLTPTMLNSKLAGLLGSGWNDLNNPVAGAALALGNFDGLARKSRQQDYTINQVSTIDRMASVNSCRWTMADANKPVANRLLLPLVALTDTPANKAGGDKILANVKYLHKHLWHQDVADTDPEVQRTYNLLVSIWNDRATAPERPTTCEYNNGNDANYMGRAWAATIAYMVGDKAFLYW